jgi:hypothetical protein
MLTVQWRLIEAFNFETPYTRELPDGPGGMLFGDKKTRLFSRV